MTGFRDYWRFLVGWLTVGGTGPLVAVDIALDSRRYGDIALTSERSAAIALTSKRAGDIALSSGG
jgi:hypothetical protein